MFCSLLFILQHLLASLELHAVWGGCESPPCCASELLACTSHGASRAVSMYSAEVMYAVPHGPDTATQVRPSDHPGATGRWWRYPGACRCRLRGGSARLHRGSLSVTAAHCRGGTSRAHT